jgi:hypothetical protein
MVKVQEYYSRVFLYKLILKNFLIHCYLANVKLALKHPYRSTQKFPGYQNMPSCTGRQVALNQINMMALLKIATISDPDCMIISL